MKICLACSAGGHLTQLLQLEGLWKRYSSFFLTFKSISTKNLPFKTYFVKNPGRNAFLFFLNIVQSFFIFLKELPDIVITNGSGIAIPISLIAKIFGKKLVFIESLSRVENPSLTGRLLYPFADLFLVQWKPLLKKYGSKAIYRGAVI